MPQQDLTNFVDQVRFLAAGQNDPQSVTLDECADEIERLREALEDIINAYNDAREKQHWHKAVRAMWIAAFNALHPPKPPDRG